MRVLDATTVNVYMYKERGRLVTRDSGLSWTRPEVNPQGTVEEVPAGAVAEVETNAGRPIGIVVLLPGRDLRGP